MINVSSPGSPRWLDLGAPDVAASAAFYSAVLGWEHRPTGEGRDVYGLFLKEGRKVAAIGPLTEEGARSAWTLYFDTPDAEAAARTVERAGGTVRVAPVDTGDMGRMAHVTDPQGAEFALWQPGSEPGLERVNQPGSLYWTELYTPDAAAAKEFYGALFGWTTSDTPLPDDAGVYSLIAPAGAREDSMHGGITQLAPEHLARTGGRAYWHPVFAVLDCDGTVARITEEGGTLLMGPEDAEGVGRLAVCLDPSDAEFVVLAPSAIWI
ncbi:VOC family protein [Streptomyces sodiiphilus]|uniref:VOC family protein n=1 Tax=Streptomyces sodiiphilus TaxID=226217 RepID=A0ABP5B2E7_9ACTN